MLDLEPTLRAFATLALLQLIALLLIGARDRSRWLAAGYALGVLAFVLTSSVHSRALLGDSHALWVLICVCKAGVFWLLARSLFDDGFSLRPAHALGIAGMAVYGLIQQLHLYALPSPTTAQQLAGFGFDLLVVGLVVSALRGVWQGLATDLVAQRRRLRLGFVAAVGGYLALAALVQIYNQLAGVRTPGLLVNANLLLMTLASLAASASLLRLRRRSWLEPLIQPRPAEGVVRPELLAALRRAMTEQRIYRQEKLSIGQLAAHLQCSEAALRQAINQGLGYRNFNDFLHAYRIDEVRQQLADAERAQIPVLTLALDVGYGSIGPFNRAFKERTGLTPTRYRRQRLAAAD